MKIITEKMVAGGSCLAHFDGKAVFVPFSLPGETLEIEITESKKDYSFAKIVTILEASAHRIEPPCPLFGRCGGCSLQMADSAYQRELRLSILNDVFSRARIVSENGICMETGSPFEYRSRFQFHRTREGGIGLKEGSANTIVPVTDCPVAVPAIREALASGSFAKAARHRNSGDRFHVFGYDGKLWQEDADSLCQLEIAGKKVSFDVRGFFQSNIPMLERLLKAACGNTHGRFLDFYAGVGTFSLFAGNGFSETVLVEHNKDSLVMAKENLSGYAGRSIFCAVSDEAWPQRPESRLQYDLAIIDPPRQGMSKKTLEWFAASNIPDLRSVSCDPVTFARDAAKLVASGYRLKEVALFDFYPQTHHIETLAFFEK